MTAMHQRNLFAGLLLLAVAVPAHSTAQAQDRVVMERLVEYGRMPRRAARALVRTISEQLAQNAERGEVRYDRVRQAVGRTLFDGPGQSRQEYEDRLQQVFARLRAGLDEPLLEALFPSAPNSAVLCANDFDVPMTDCDALIAAASREMAALPHSGPVDGSDLRASLRAAGVARSTSAEIATALSTVMLGVPRVISRDARGRGLLHLLSACPGALTTRESQIRAWHVGPTAGMARCIAQALIQGRAADRAVEGAETLLGMSDEAATAFLGWAAPEAMTRTEAPTPVAASAPAGPPAAATPRQLIAQARQHYRARRFAQAAAAYQQLTRFDQTNARAYAGLGSARLSLGDASGALAAFQTAISLQPGNPGFHAFTGQAHMVLGDRERAASSFRRALAIAPDHPMAQAGMQRLSARPSGPGPQPPRASAPPPRANLDQVRQQARAHFQARRFAQAAAAYDQMTRLSPTAGAYAGLGAARMSMGDANGAVQAYQTAVRMTPTHSGFWTMLARAQHRSGYVDAAITSLRRAVALDPDNTTAQEGLVRLTPPPAPAGPAAGQPGVASGPQVASGQPAMLPDLPRRDQIIAVMRPLQAAVAGCAPSFHGRVTFRLTVTGPDGAVAHAQLEAEGLAGTPEAECMTGVAQSATFPRFARDQLDIAYPYEL